MEAFNNLQLLDSDISQIEDNVSVASETPQATAASIQPVVTIPATGKEIYKATLVTLLNKDPKLSHDR